MFNGYRLQTYWHQDKPGKNCYVIIGLIAWLLRMDLKQQQRKWSRVLTGTSSQWSIQTAMNSVISLTFVFFLFLKVQTFISNQNRMWRKSRSVNPFSECNQNYDDKWMCKSPKFIALYRETLTSSPSQDPCSGGYAGSFPYSEFENLHLADAAYALKGQLKAFLTLHSDAQVFLSPCGDMLMWPGWPDINTAFLSLVSTKMPNVCAV